MLNQLIRINKLHFIPFAILTFTLFYKHIFAQFKN